MPKSRWGTLVCAVRDGSQAPSFEAIPPSQQFLLRTPSKKNGSILFETNRILDPSGTELRLLFLVQLVSLIFSSLRSRLSRAAIDPPRLIRPRLDDCDTGDYDPMKAFLVNAIIRVLKCQSFDWSHWSSRQHPASTAPHCKTSRP